MYIFLLKESPMDLISSSIISKFKFFFYQGHFIGKAVTNLLDIHKKREYDCSQAHSRPTKLSVQWDCPSFSQVVDPFSCPCKHVELS